MSINSPEQTTAQPEANDSEDLIIGESLAEATVKPSTGNPGPSSPQPNKSPGLKRQDSLALTESEKNTFEVGRMLKARYMSSLSQKKAGESDRKTMKELLQNLRFGRKK